MAKVKTVALWALTILFWMSGLGHALSGYVFGGLLHILCGVLTAPIPAIRDALQGVRVRGKWKAILVIILLIVAVPFVNSDAPSVTDKAAPEEAAVEAEAESVPDGGETAGETEDETVTEPEPVSEPEAEPAPEPEPELTGKEKVDADLRAIVSEKYRDTRVTEITLNDNLGSEAEDDYVALIYLRWNVQNGPDMTKSMIAMYSEDFAARIGADIPAVTDVAVFWTVPYYSEETAAKYSYERRDNGGMYKTDEVWTGVVR